MAAPRATYRVQLQLRFDFAAAAELAIYLAELGVSHLYASPVTQAVPGSTHGYDVVDSTRPSEELGGEDGLAALHEALTAAGLGLVVDIVPNHRAAHPADREWWSLLRDGRDCPGGRFFDVDWDAPGANGRVVLPILGRPLETALADGSVALEDDAEFGLVIVVDDHVVPVAPGTAAPDDDPAAVLDRQHYRLGYWRDLADLVNYRRFFDITDLPAVRVEDPVVFDVQHALTARLLRDGVADGVRVDHVDGLRDPVTYLRRVRALGAHWLLVEKILGRDELLSDAFDADGTTGYEFAERVGGILIDPDGEEPLTELWTEIAQDSRGFDDVVAEARASVLDELVPDLDRVERAFAGAVGTHDDVRRSLAALLTTMEVYRTYIGAGEQAGPADRGRIDTAVTRASLAGGSRPGLAAIGEVLTGARRGLESDEARLRFQQLSTAVAAKGVEDTALYRYLRLTARNEVGGDPGRFAGTVEAFHAANERAAERHPLGLLALSTHDTKRSADVRARLAVLSEVQPQWRDFLARRMARLATAWNGVEPDHVAEYLVLQTAVGAWPIDEFRLGAYMRKAAREAKRRTSWRDPDEQYEAALDRVVASLLGDPAARADVEVFAALVLVPGRVNSLTQVVLQCAAPGVPDVYQGDELWNLTLVDPDNRAPLDPARSQSALGAVRAMETPPSAALIDPADPGLPKLWTFV